MNTPRSLALASAVTALLLLLLPADLIAISPNTYSSLTALLQQDDDTEREKKRKEREKKKKGEEDSQLGDFESEASSPKASTASADSDDDIEEYGFVARVALYTVVGGTIGSWYRVTGTPNDSDLEKYFGVRQIGDPGLPYVSLTLSYQNVASDVEGLDANLEGGFGPLGLRFRSTKFREQSPDAELDLSWAHVVWRMSYTKHFGVDFGGGGIFLDGRSDESGGSFMMGFGVDVSHAFGLYYKPTWGWINNNTISDHDLGLRFGVRFVSLRLGYRWTTAGSTTLEGTIIGGTLSF